MYVTDLTDDEAEAAVECIIALNKLICHLTCRDNV